MSALRQTFSLAALIVRAFVRDPGAVLEMMFHHHLGDRDRVPQLVERVKKAGEKPNA